MIAVQPVSALYVDPKGPYYKLLGPNNCWDSQRDARTYEGTNPIVAHPPCGPWGTLAKFCTKQDKTLAPFAVRQVRKWGGIHEHPCGSRLWNHCRLWKPGEFTDSYGGWTLQVDQVRWGHKCRKRTWLYIVGLPRDTVLDLPPPRAHTHMLSGGSKERTGRTLPVLWSTEARLTPPDFAAWLVYLASLCRV